MLFLVIVLGCQSKDDRLMLEYTRDLLIHENLMTNRALKSFENDSSVSDRALDVITYIDAILDRLKGFDNKKDYNYFELDQLDSLLDYRTNTEIFYGVDADIPSRDDYSFLNLKIKLESYLNRIENKELSEILFPEFQKGELIGYNSWSWELIYFYNLPLIQLVINLKELKLKVYQLEAIRLATRN